jgi:hypothetical protein
MKQLLLICTTLFSFLLAKADCFDATKDGSTVVVHESNHDDRLFIYNILLNQKREMLISERSRDWVKIVRDSLVMVQYTSGNEKTILYSLATGNKVFSSPENCFPDGGENFLYWVGSDWKLHKYDLNDFKSYETSIVLEKPKGYDWPAGYLKISSDDSRLALVINAKKGSAIAIYEMATGKLVNDFDGFKFFFAFSRSSLYKDDLAFFDLNSDGTRLVTGNAKWARLYDVNKGKKLGEFEENSSTQSKDFGNAIFSADGKLVYLQSRYRLFFMRTTDFKAERNIIVGGKLESYGSNSYLEANFTWNNIAVTSDNRYLFTICLPSMVAKIENKGPFMMRKDISITGPNKPLNFYYK